MDVAVQVAILSGSVALILGVVNHWLAVRAQVTRERQAEKLNHYKVLISGISALVTTPSDDEIRNFTLAFNTLVLVAPQTVIEKAMRLHDYIGTGSKGLDQKAQDEYLLPLYLEVRKDLRLPYKDVPATFHFQLLNFTPSNRQR